MVGVTVMLFSGRYMQTQLLLGEATALMAKWSLSPDGTEVVAISDKNSFVTFVRYRDIESISYPVEPSS